MAPISGAVQPSSDTAELAGSRERRGQQEPTPVASDNKAEVDVSKAMDLAQAQAALPASVTKDGVDPAEASATAEPTPSSVVLAVTAPSEVSTQASGASPVAAGPSLPHSIHSSFGR